MRLRSQRLSKILLFAVIMAAFGLIEYSVWYKFSFPDHAVPGRHKIIPALSLENKLFGEFDGSAKIPIPVDTAPLDLKTLLGVQFKTGTYGQTIRAERANIVTAEGQILCTAVHKIPILENQWTPVTLNCSGAGSVSGPLYLQLDLAHNEHWALYQFAGKQPAIQFWFTNPEANNSFFEARNYGSLWSPAILLAFRILARALIACGLMWMLCYRRTRTDRRFMLAGLLIWCGLFWGQFFETVSFHNSDETMHVAGAVREVTGEAWPSAHLQLRRSAAKVQFYETFARVGSPIVAGRYGAEWISADNYFVNPENRSGTYDFMMRPITQASLHLASSLDFMCSDPVIYIRAFLALVITGLVLISSWFYIKSEHSIGFWVLLVIVSVPAVLASLLTIWNYGLLTVLGALFCVNLIPQTHSKSSFKFFMFSSALIPILAELARSQVFWLMIGPFVVTAAWFYRTSTDSSQTVRTKVHAISWFALSSTGVYALFIALYGDTFIPDRSAVTVLLESLSNRRFIPAVFVSQEPLLVLGGMHVAIWFLSGAFFLLLNETLNYLETLRRSYTRWMRLFWSIGILVALFIVIAKCWSIHDISSLSSLASASPYPTFPAHFKEAYRALMSQTFSRYQDYFLVQTFFMAYGWLEVTGHWFVYFIFRHLVEVGLIAVLLASIKGARTFLQLYLPAWTAFAFYFFAVWYGAWHGHFTIIGRLIFPAAGLLIFPMILASGEVTRVYGRVVGIVKTDTVAQVLFFYLLANAVYGAFYLLPLRFIVGL